MKKLTTALLTALLLLNLAACGEKEPDDTPSGYDDSLISELYSEEGEYTDAENNTLAYSYHVPRIVSETAVAAALNDEIADQFGALVQEQKNMMASRVSLTCLSVTWTSYWNDSLLCLVVRAEMDGDTSMTETYSYDFFGGKRLMSEGTCWRAASFQRRTSSRRRAAPRQTTLMRRTEMRSAAAWAARTSSRPTPSAARGRSRTRTSTRKCGSISTAARCI